MYRWQGLGLQVGSMIGFPDTGMLFDAAKSCAM